MPTKPLTIIQVLPELNSGGVEKGTLEIGQYLSQQGHRSIVVSAGGPMVRKLLEQGSEHIQANIGTKSLMTLKYIPWFRALLLAIKPDILHLRSRLPAWICYLAWKSLPKASRPRLVTTFHGQHSVNRYSAIMTCGERVITVSDFMRDYIVHAFPQVDSSKIRVIYRGVDTRLYNPDYHADKQWLEQWHQQFPQTKNKKLLILPGRISRRKGIEDFLNIVAEASRLTPNIHGLVVGGASSLKTAYLEEVKALVTSKGLDQLITFTGQRDDLRNIMSVSSILLSLSQKPEAFGRTVTEALSLGIPVVAYDHGGVSEQLRQLFPAGSVPLSDYKLATQRVLETLQQKNVKIANNRCYTLSSMCSETLNTYKDLLALNINNT